MRVLQRTVTMKHNRLQLMTRVCLLAIFPLVNQACSDSPDPLTDIEENKASQIVAPSVPDSIFRFATIEELESVAPEMLADNLSGYKMSEMTYECTDTVDLRALRYDVSATLTSPTGQETTLTFTAEVGPELVSVEYYPTGFWMPAHDNIFYPNFHPIVERYRNYSDGTRIGPDLFYDYGHFMIFFSTAQYPQCHYSIRGREIVLSENLVSSFCNPLLIEDGYKDGVFFQHCVEQIEINTNAIVWMEGRQYFGEDLVPHHPNWWNTGERHRYDTFSPLYGNYYSRSYVDSWLVNDQDEEMMNLYNLCRNVPDVSPVSYPKDTKSLTPGFYITDGRDIKLFEPYAVSTLWEQFGGGESYSSGFTIGDELEFYTHYLVIDGRIIHYDNLMKDYKGLDNLRPTFSETKTAEGYNIHREISWKYLGGEFKSINDLRIKCTKGPKYEVYAFDEYGGLNSSRDQEELDKMQTASRSSGRAETPARIERPDGKYMEIDRRLPASIRSLQTKRTLNPDTK